MAETVQSLIDWFEANPNARGTPEFVQKAQQYRDLRSQEKTAAQPAAAPAAPAASGAPAPATSDPEGAYATAGRFRTGAPPPHAIHDLPAGSWNYGGTRFLINKIGSALGYGSEDQPLVGEIPSSTAALRNLTNVAELPEDASYTRRLTEGGA